MEEVFGHRVRIVGKKGEVSAHLKKKGAYDNLLTTLELRVGDMLVVYFTPDS